MLAAVRRSLVTDGPGQFRHVAVVMEGRVDPLRVVEVRVAHVPAPFGLRGRVTLQVMLGVLGLLASRITEDTSRQCGWRPPSCRAAG